MAHGLGAHGAAPYEAFGGYGGEWRGGCRKNHGKTQKNGGLKEIIIESSKKYGNILVRKLCKWKFFDGNIIYITGGFMVIPPLFRNLQTTTAIETIQTFWHVHILM